MAVYRRLTCPRWPSRQKPEDGFTLVEVLVAMGVIFSALLVMAFTMLGAFKTVGFSRQRTQATGLANQALEQIRALPVDALFMSAQDLPVDSQLLPSGCLAVVPTTCTFGTNPARVVPVANYGGSFPPRSPLAPHHVNTVTSSPGTTSYTVKSYLTLDSLDATGQTRIATVQVVWDNPQQGGVAPNVQVESKIHTSPFTNTAPATHAYDGTATDTAGVISVGGGTGTLLNQSGIALTYNLPNVNAHLAGDLNGTSVGGGVSGPASVSGGTTGAGLTALGLALPPTTPAAADHASRSAGQVGADGPHKVDATPGTVMSLDALQGTALGLLTGNLTGQVAAGAVTEAGAFAASKATGGGGSVPIGAATVPASSDQRGYGKAEVTQTGPISADLSIISLLNIPLIRATPAGNASPDFATVAEAPSGTSQTYTATAEKNFGQLDILPSGLPAVPAGFLPPIVSLTGFQAKASACATGAGGTCPASTASESGTLKVLGQPFNLSSLLPGSIGPLPAIPTVNIGLVKLVITVSATLGAKSSATPGAASVTSPLTIHVNLVVSTALTGTLSNLNIDVDMGNVSTTANYS